MPIRPAGPKLRGTFAEPPMHGDVLVHTERAPRARRTATQQSGMRRHCSDPSRLLTGIPPVVDLAGSWGCGQVVCRRPIDDVLLFRERQFGGNAKRMHDIHERERTAAARFLLYP